MYIIKSIKTIKTKTLALLCFFGLIVPTSSYAIIVSDPTSYSYYVQQLKKSVEQINMAKTSLDQAQHLNQSFDGYMRDLRTNFDFVGNIKNSLSAELGSFENYKRSLSSSQLKSLDFSRQYDLKSLRDIIDTNLDGIYVDPTDPEYSASEIKKYRTIERQRLLKQGLIKTEEKLALLEQKYKNLEKLAEKAPQTTTPKEAADLSNAILLEILSAMHSLIDVISTLGQAEMAAGFINYSKEAHANKIRIDKARYKNGYPDKKFASQEEKDAWFDGCVAFKRKNGHTNTTVNGVDCAQRAYRKKVEKRNKEYEAFRDPRI